MTDGFGLFPTIVKPPYTTLTAYDLNSGTIAWQKGLGDDLRLLTLGITGTGSAATVKGGLIVTGTGLRVRHGGRLQGARLRQRHRRGTDDAAARRADAAASLSMYEHGGRQYLLVTASAAQAASGPAAVPLPHKRTNRPRRLRAARGHCCSQEPLSAAENR